MNQRGAVTLRTGRLTTHVLDTMSGKPAKGLGIDLFHLHDGHAHELASVVTNDDGRCDQPLLDGAQMQAGTYELVFNVGAYFAKLSVAQDTPFLETVPVRFVISAPDTHYHVPLLVSPYSYSTYKGS